MVNWMKDTGNENDIDVVFSVFSEYNKERIYSRMESRWDI
jgi:hypothetical protein